MRHFICNAALDASSRFAANEFLLLHGLHEILSMKKPLIIAELGARQESLISKDLQDSSHTTVPGGVHLGSCRGSFI